MKKKIFLAATAALLVTTAAAFVYANNKSSDDDFWNRNIEALADDEIITGDLCMYTPDRLCISLGEEFHDHTRA